MTCDDQTDNSVKGKLYIILMSRSSLKKNMLNVLLESARPRAA
jgi:hypothetical protein